MSISSSAKEQTPCSCRRAPSPTGRRRGERPGASFVLVVENGRARRVDVKTGAVGTAKVEIVSGLKDSDRVVVDRADRLKDGEAVRDSP